MSYMIGNIDGIPVMAQVNNGTDANAMHAILRGLLHLRDKFRWIPVSEGMPETMVPVLAAAAGKGSPIRAAYVAAHSLNTDDMNYEGDAVYDEGEDAYYWPEGWYEWNRFEETHWRATGVTHWMNLPEPPR